MFTSDSDNSYYSCSTYSLSDTKLNIEEDIASLNTDSDSKSVRPITDSNNDVIIIEDDDSEVKFVGKTHRFLKWRKNKLEKGAKENKSTSRTS